MKNKLSYGKEQRPRSDAKTGFVRLFIANALSNKERTERLAAEKMSEITSDIEWKTDTGYECSILEHHMAASRFSFGNLYAPLNESKEFDSALRKGEIAEISFLANTISPLVKAHQANNTFEIAKIVRQGSPLLSKKALSLQPDKQKQKLEQAESATQSLIALWDDGKIPSCIDVLSNLKESGLYEISERMEEIIDSTYAGDDPYEKAMIPQLDFFRNRIGLTERDGDPVRFSADLIIGEYTSEKSVSISDNKSIMDTDRLFRMKDKQGHDCFVLTKETTKEILERYINMDHEGSFITLLNKAI